MTLEGTTFYCGDNCNHTGPHRYRPVETPFSTAIVITHCPHGLDMRIHPRCYLCTPDRAAAASAPTYVEVHTSACHAGSDGDCSWSECPQEANERRDYQTSCPLLEVATPAWSAAAASEETSR